MLRVPRRSCVAVGATAVLVDVFFTPMVVLMVVETKATVIMAGDDLVRQPEERAMRGPTALEFFFLQRLASLVMRQDAAHSEQERLLLAQAAFSTYLDCASLRLNAEADAIMSRDPHARVLWQPSKPI